MVIINTNAVEVSIQAVSPELILSVPMSVGSVGPAGAAAAGADESAGAGAAAWALDGAEAGVSSAHAAGMESVKRPRTANRKILVINANPLLDCLSVPLVGANAYDLREIEDKNLSVADLAGLGRIGNRFDDLVSQRVVDGDFNFCLGYELDCVFGAPIDFGVPALPPEAAYLGDGDSLHAHVGNSLANIIKFERFDNCGY